jgi:hypothetical protein
VAHADVDNRTPFAFQALFLADEDGQPVVVPVIKATFDILAGGSLDLSEEQAALILEGESNGAPGESSLRFEPEVAFIKPATDVVLIGHAHATQGRGQTDVEFRIGDVGSRVRVTGDRQWERRFGTPTPSPPRPFDRIPLIYERAFGGWDRSPDDPTQHTFHPRNPVGVGFRSKHSKFIEGAPLPNLEYSDSIVTSYQAKCVPAGFCFVSPDWEPRSRYAGTFDDAWNRKRMPALPKDFDRRFFNAASAGLIAKGHLRGDEVVQIRGASPEGSLGFRLPAPGRTTCRIAFQERRDETLDMPLDTVIVDLDARKLFMLWRCHAVLWDGPQEVRGFEVACDTATKRRGPRTGGVVSRLELGSSRERA